MTGIRVAAVAGATGLVGSELVRQLSGRAEYQRVIALVRRDVTFPVGIDTQVKELACLLPSDLTGVTDVFCCVGTTIRKAGSRDAFRAVDHDAVLHLARAARAAGVARFLLVTSVDANSQSANFYLRVKGELENSLQQINLPASYVFRPSLLVGERAEVRKAEKAGVAIARALNPLLIGPLRKYKPVEVGMLAGSMICAALSGPPGQHIWEYNEFSRYQC